MFAEIISLREFEVRKLLRNRFFVTSCWSYSLLVARSLSLYLFSVPFSFFLPSFLPISSRLSFIKPGHFCVSVVWLKYCEPSTMKTIISRESECYMAKDRRSTVQSMYCNMILVHPLSTIFAQLCCGSQWQFNQWLIIRKARMFEL